ncbi:MAG: putative nucleotidyltransferase substrate binding domain-containing protein, partial [Myxococcota bacterium]
GQVMGMITGTDLLRVQAAHPVYMVGEINKQTDVAGLARSTRRMAGVVQRLAQASVRAAEVGRLVTFVADAVTERLITLAEEELGPAPARYAWVGLGSQGRNELGMSSDQDNALVLEPGGQAHDAYFLELAQRVNHGLAECGFPLCTGEVMASNPQWRQPSTQWAEYFRAWIDTPSTQALMNASVYFDMRTVHGDDALVRDLRRPMLERAQRNDRFLATLARSAVEYRPPLGFFRQFVLDEGGEEGKALDLKHRGLAPVVSLARVYAMATGSEEVETRERIRDARDRGGLHAKDAASLLDAHAFIAQVRLRHQADQLAEAKQPDNFVSPDSLSAFERSHLRDAFKVVADLQRGLEYRYKTGMLG